MEKAKTLKVKGRWDMNKNELMSAVEKQELALRKQKIKIGVLVAFRNIKSKMESGKVESCNGDWFAVVTSYGKLCNVPLSKIEWVKTGKRWPRFIYNEFKA